MTAPLLAVDELEVVFVDRRGRETRAVDGVTFSVRPGETVAVVGESGCGKTVTSLAVLGLLPDRGVKISGRVEFDGRQMLGMSDHELRSMQGKDLAMIFQDPMTSLNPVLTVGRQIAEVGRFHLGMNREESRDLAVEMLAKVGIPDPKRRAREFPHQMSGGMRQRAMIAIALACKPRLLVADEPTTALDVTIQAQILELLRELVSGSGTALVLITHDLGVVAGMCDTVHVMYAGRIVESAPRRELFGAPRHPYTVGLLGSVPRLDQPRGVPLHPIAGSPRDTIAWVQGCAFSPRCPNAADDCVSAPPALEPDRRADHMLRCYHPMPVLDAAPPVLPTPPVVPAVAPPPKPARRTTRRRAE